MSGRRSLPIAVFDSGVGGLTVLHEFLVSLPSEDYLYLGDTDWFPYGTKAPQELSERVGRTVEYLLDRGSKLLVVACNSAATAALDVAREQATAHGVEVVAVIEPESEIAAAITENGRVGVLATPATVSGGGYHRALEGQGPALSVTEVAAPDLAPMIERGDQFDDRLVATVRGYCAPFAEAGCDTVILGCTHYPLLAPMLQRILGRDVRLVTAGHAIAAAAQRLLERDGIESPNRGEGSYRFLCTGELGRFRELGTRFLQLPLGEVDQITVGGPATSTILDQ